MEALVTLVRDRLAELDWSLTRLASESGVPKSTLSSWMTGERGTGTRGPSAKHLRAVAQALRVDTVDVFEAAGRAVPEGMTPQEERNFVNLLRALPEDGRAVALATIQALVDQGKKP